MKPITLIILKYSGILLSLLLFNYWLLFFSHFNIPEFIPHTPIKIDGLLICTYIIAIFIFAEKQIFKINATITIAKLTFSGLLIGVIAEFLFQCIRLFTGDNDSIYYLFSAVVMIGAIEAFISFFIAFQLKTKRTGLLLILISIFLILFKAATILFPAMPN